MAAVVEKLAPELCSSRSLSPPWTAALLLLPLSPAFQLKLQGAQVTVPPWRLLQLGVASVVAAAPRDLQHDTGADG